MFVSIYCSVKRVPCSGHTHFSKGNGVRRFPFRFLCIEYGTEIQGKISDSFSCSPDPKFLVLPLQ